jgi:hypothetical protein
MCPRLWSQLLRGLRSRRATEPRNSKPNETLSLNKTYEVKKREREREAFS